jgi:PPM family protein phosphatase
MTNTNPPPAGQTFSVGIVHDVGSVRTNNEDSSWIPPQDMEPTLLTERGWLFIVADGMGGYQAGEVASRLAVEAASQSYYSAHAGASVDITAWLHEAVQVSQQAILNHQAQELAGAQIGSTLVMAVIHDAELYIANVGDSRCYRLRDGKLEQLSRDHSWVADQVRAELLTPEEAANNPQRNILTRGLGQTDKYARADVDTHDWRAGDRLLLCSDGLWDAVPVEQLSTLIAIPDADEAAHALVRAALDNTANDNVTALVVASASKEEPLVVPITAPITAPLPAITSELTDNAPSAPAEIVLLPPTVRPVQDAAQHVTDTGTQRSSAGKRVLMPIVLMVGVALLLVLIAAVILFNQVLTQPRTAISTRAAPVSTVTAVMKAGNDLATPTEVSVPTVTPLDTKPVDTMLPTQTYSEAVAASTPVAAEPSPTAPQPTVTAMPVLAAGSCVTRAVVAADWQLASNTVPKSDSVGIIGTRYPIVSKDSLATLLQLPDLHAPFTLNLVARSQKWSISNQVWACFTDSSTTSIASCQGLKKVQIKDTQLDEQTQTRSITFNFDVVPQYQRLQLAYLSTYYIYLMQISYCAAQ